MDNFYIVYEEEKAFYPLGKFENANKAVQKQWELKIYRHSTMARYSEEEKEWKQMLFDKYRKISFEEVKQIEEKLDKKYQPKNTIF